MRVRMSVLVIAILLTLTPVCPAKELVQAPPAPTRWQKIKTFISEHREAIISSAVTAAAVVLLLRWYYQREMATLGKKSARDQDQAALLQRKIVTLAAERDSALQRACEAFAENKRLIGEFQRLQTQVPHVELKFSPDRIFSPLSSDTNPTSAAQGARGGSPDESDTKPFRPRILADEFGRPVRDGSKTG